MARVTLGSFETYPDPYPKKPLPLVKGTGFRRVGVRVPAGSKTRRGYPPKSLIKKSILSIIYKKYILNVDNAEQDMWSWENHPNTSIKANTT